MLLLTHHRDPAASKHDHSPTAAKKDVDARARGFVLRSLHRRASLQELPLGRDLSADRR